MPSPPAPNPDEILARSRAGRPWEVIEPAERLLRADPSSHEVRACLIVHAASVGLRTLAGEQIERLPPEVRRTPQVTSLAAQIDRLPDDRLSSERLTVTLEGNLRVVRERRGVDLTGLLPEWRGRLERIEAFVSASGNVVWRRSGGADQPGEWLSLSDRRTAVESGRLPFLDESGHQPTGAQPKPIIIEGLDPPWLALRAWASTPPLPDGSRSRLVLVQADAMEVLDGLCLADLSGLLTDERVELFIGPESGDRFGAFFADRLAYALPAHLLRTPGLRTLASPDLASVLQTLHDRQQAEHTRLRDESHRLYADPDPASWARRFASFAGADRGKPVRILIPATRYSTYVRHAAEDLAASLRALGAEVRTLTEPDGQTLLASVAYLREFAEWRPDLVVCINYTRRHLGQSVPEHVPFVCWVQDRMPQLFDERAAPTGPLDFLVGHLHPELFTLSGCDKARADFWFVPASTRVFHDAPVAPALALEHECEIAYVSHQSEPPEVTLERFIAPYRSQPGVERLFRLVFGALRQHFGADGPPTHRQGYNLKELMNEAGVPMPDDRTLHALAGFQIQPLAERIYRHTTLRWVADTARRNKWRFRLYGNGWERHPELAEFASGPIAHDEHLRAVYRSARVHLHTSVLTNAHQRVAECALSGGLMIRRGPSPDLDLALGQCRRLLMRRAEPTERLENGEWRYTLSLPGDHDDWSNPDPVRFRRMKMAEDPAPDAGGGYTITWRIPKPWRDSGGGAMPDVPLSQLPDYAFPRAHETLFRTPDELERLVQRAVGDAGWREATVAGHRAATARWMSTDTAAGRLIGFVRGGLAGGTLAPR